MPPRLNLLGGASLFAADGRPVSGGAAQPRRLAVLAVLADAWPATVTRDRVVGLIWPEHDDAGARRLLTQALYALRRELGDFTSASGHDIGIDAEALSVDLIEFRRALRAGELERAVELHRGAALEGFHLRDAVEFERWTDMLRADVARAYEAAVDALLTRCEGDGAMADAVRWSERLLHASPLDAGTVLRYMALAEQAGDPGAALAAGAAYAQRMHAELGLAPDAAVQARLDALRASGSRVPAPSVAPSVAARTVAVDDVPALPPHVPDESRNEASAVASSPAALPAVAASDARPSVTLPPAAASPDDAPPSLWRLFGVVGAVAAASVALVLAISHASGRDAALERTSARTSATTAGERHVLLVPAFAVRVVGADTGTIRRAGETVGALVAADLDGAGGWATRASGAPGDSAGGAVLATLDGLVVVEGARVRLEAALRSRASGAGSASDAPVASVSGSRDSLGALADRLAMQLMPALFDETGRGVDPALLRGFTRAAALRRFLEGEAALRRGAFDDAWAAMRAATETDSLHAMAWYRRAVAAEMAHKNGDADRSLARAVALAGRLPERDRRMLQAYATWRAGDARRAEPMLRTLAASQMRDRDAWFQLAELAYHAGPLMGRSPDAARDLWREVVSLDSSNYPALMHLVRLEARSGDTAATAHLLRRAAAVHAVGAQALESEVIGAYGSRDAQRIAAVAPMLDTLPDYSLDFLHATVAGLLEQPAAAEGIARRLTSAGRPDAVRASGYLALAHLAVARGRWQAAMAALDSAATFNAVAAAWTRAWLVAMPGAPDDPALRERARRALVAVPGHAQAAPLYLQLAVDAQAAAVIQRYLEALLADPAGGRMPGLGCDRAASGDGAGDEARALGPLCADLSDGLAAEVARRAGRADVALARLEGLRLVVPYQFAGRSVFFARTRERWLRAELLREAGRDDDAEAWYASAPFEARYDYVLLAMSHLRRGQLRERRGDRSEAARHYRAALHMWRDGDAWVAPMRREATDGLARVTGQARAD